MLLHLRPNTVKVYAQLLQNPARHAVALSGYAQQVGNYRDPGVGNYDDPNPV